MSSLTVINVFDLPACLFTSAAMRLRRLYSITAVTIASRFVFAFVKRTTSSSSLSGISRLVFMIPLSAQYDSESIAERIHARYT